jgi:hypothetical protein
LVLKSWCDDVLYTYVVRNSLKASCWKFHACIASMQSYMTAPFIAQVWHFDIESLWVYNNMFWILNRVCTLSRVSVWIKAKNERISQAGHSVKEKSSIQNTNIKKQQTQFTSDEIICNWRSVTDCLKKVLKQW